MGPRSQYLETVLTCMGDYYSPDFHRQLSLFREQLQQLIFDGGLDVSLSLNSVDHLVVFNNILLIVFYVCFS